MRSRLAFALTLTLLASPAHADWKRDYDRGLKAVEAGQWSEAEAAFRAALSEEGAPSAKKRFQGVVVKVYVPHYYAGLAAYRQGQCQRALDYWNNAASASVVAGLSDLSGTQSRGIADCKTKLAQVDKPPDKPVVVTQPDKPIVTPPTKPPEKPVVIAPPPQKPPPTEPVKPPVVTPSATPAPAALISAVESYLAGRYADVTKFEPSSLADGRAKAQGFLLRAASRHTLAELAANDRAQLEQARQDVRAARSANAGLNPDETLFSPRFRAFWRATR